MTASDATATIKKGSSEPSFDKTAQRILNLFFVLNSSPEPLTTEQIFSMTGRPVDLTQHNYTLFANLLAFPLMRTLGTVQTEKNNQKEMK